MIEEVRVNTLEELKAVVGVWSANGYMWGSPNFASPDDAFRNGERQFIGWGDEKIYYELVQAENPLSFDEFVARNNNTFKVTLRQFELLTRLKGWVVPFEALLDEETGLNDAKQLLAITDLRDQRLVGAFLRYLGGDERIKFEPLDE